jgi:PAS domain S-box-containing protein
LGTIAHIIRGRLARQIYVVVAVTLALLLRVALAEHSIALPTYITFFPVVCLAAVLGGIWEGILATTFSALMADYFLLEPVGQFTIHSASDFTGLAIFCVFGITVSVVTGLYQRRREKLGSSKIEAAILDVRRNVEESEELAETVRAERLRFLKVLESLRAARSSKTPSGNVQNNRESSETGHDLKIPVLDQKKIKASLRWTLVIPLLAAMVLAGAMLWAASDLTASMQWVDHTDQVIGQSQRLLKLMADMETGERGYLVTGNDLFLQPYQEASKVIDPEYKKLYFLVADSPGQQTLLKEIHENLYIWQAYAKQMIAMRRAGGVYSDLSINLTGKAEVDEIRDQIAAFQSVEEHLRDERNSTARRDWRLLATIYIFLGLGVGSGLALFTLRRIEAVAASFEESGRALEESERRWVTTLASIGDAVMAVDKDGRVTFLNAVATDLTGWQPEDALGQPIQNVFHIVNEQTRIPAEDIVNRVLNDGRVAELANHTALLAKDGREIPIADSAAPIFDSNGETTGVVLVFRDVTERRRAENVLQATLQRFYMILSNLYSGILLVTDEGKIEFANSAFCDLFGLKESPAELMANFDAETVIARINTAFKDPDQGVLRIREILAHGLSVFSEEVRMQNGATFLRDFVPLTVDEKSYGRMWVQTDITNLKQGEEQLKKLNRALAARSNSDLAILNATDETSFLEEVCRIITSDCGHSMVWIGMAEQDEHKSVRVLAHSGFDEGYLETLRITWDESERGRGPTGTAIRTGQPSMCRNMQTDPAFAPWREDAVKRGYASSVVIPLKEGNETWGAITIYAREPDAFSEEEVSLLTELAGDVEFGIQTLRMRAAHSQAEELLRESEELLGLFVEHAPASLAMFDNQMRYLHASRRWMVDYGLGDRKLRGLSHYEVFPELPEQWREAHRRGLAGEVVRGEADPFERVDGSVQWVRWEVHPWSDAEGKVGGIVIFSEEITERKKAEEALLNSEKLAFQRQQLQALAERLQRAREEERKMVARDLHDEIGQILTAIKFDMTWVVRHLPDSDDGVHKRLAASIDLISDGVNSVRRICSGLRPGILDDLGLVATVEWQAKEFTARNGIACQVSVPPGELHLDGDRATAVFRIFQECLTNVARHAEAQSVRASMDMQDETLVLVVEDDGKGFCESEVGGSLGVLGMQERAAAWGGSVRVSSSPGKGTTVTVRVPLHDASIEWGDHAHSDSR